MAVVIHKTFQGEPVGVHTENGEPYYLDGFDRLKASGERLVGARPSKMPWPTFIAMLEDRTSHQDWWEVVDVSDPQEALDAARVAYFESQTDQRFGSS